MDQQVVAESPSGRIMENMLGSQKLLFNVRAGPLQQCLKCISRLEPFIANVVETGFRDLGLVRELLAGAGSPPIKDLVPLEVEVLAVVRSTEKRVCTGLGDTHLSAPSHGEVGCGLGEIVGLLGVRQVDFIVDANGYQFIEGDASVICSLETGLKICLRHRCNFRVIVRGSLVALFLSAKPQWAVLVRREKQQYRDDNCHRDDHHNCRTGCHNEQFTTRAIGLNWTGDRAGARGS